LAALIAGDSAGADHRRRLAAGIRVCKKDVKGIGLSFKSNAAATRSSIWPINMPN
jgi:hypothetical protein